MGTYHLLASCMLYCIYPGHVISCMQRDRDRAKGIGTEGQGQVNIDRVRGTGTEGQGQRYRNRGTGTETEVQGWRDRIQRDRDREGEEQSDRGTRRQRQG